jgi:hypothetical protein
MPRKGEPLPKKTRARLSAALRKSFREYVAGLDPATFPTTKRCTKCGEVKPISAFSVRRFPLKSGFIAIRPLPSCKPCKAREVKERRERRMAEGVDVAAIQRVYNARRLRTPEIREYHREWSAIRRRKEGVVERGPNAKTPEGRGKSLPLEPIAKLLREEVKRRGNVQIVAAACGLNPRRINGICREEEKGVTLRVIDAILTGLGMPEELPRLYPEEDGPDLSYGYHYIQNGHNGNGHE